MDAASADSIFTSYILKKLKQKTKFAVKEFEYMLVLSRYDCK